MPAPSHASAPGAGKRNRFCILRNGLEEARSPRRVLNLLGDGKHFFAVSAMARRAASMRTGRMQCLGMGEPDRDVAFFRATVLLDEVDRAGCVGERPAMSPASRHAVEAVAW